MPLPQGLDPNLLRAFAFIAEEGSFTRAAARVGRTQSAVSMQMQRLEALLGQRLLLRAKGGSVLLTPHGQYLLGRVRALLALHDEIWSAFRMPLMQGMVRFGTPDDYALSYVPAVLKRFADSHPAVEVEVLCAPSNELAERLKAGGLDLTLCTEGDEPEGWPLTELWRGPMRWVTSERFAPHRLVPLPLALPEEQGYGWRRAAVTALERAGIPHRIAYTSATLAGTHAPVLAGLAVTVSAIEWVPPGLRALRPGELLPDLPDTAILLLKGRQAHQPATDALARHIAETFHAETRRSHAG